MTSIASCAVSASVALHPEGVDRNGYRSHKREYGSRSPSTRRAWIEIAALALLAALFSSPSTRRAWIEIPLLIYKHLFDLVALHPEGVDRNIALKDLISKLRKSPSTRRAWIEIVPTVSAVSCASSPSTRRAWIEMAYI